MVKNDVVQEEYQIFADVWKLYKQYYDQSTDEGYWPEVLEESRKISNTYNSHLCNDLVVAVVDELERKYLKENSLELKKAI